MNNDETYTYKDTEYIEPTLSSDEQMEFIKNLRATQETSNQQIEDQTRNLGSDVAITQGGLTSGATSPDSYFMSRYQTPYVDSQVASLKSAAQAKALSDVLSNYQSQLRKKYDEANNAYNRAYSSYQARRSTSSPDSTTKTSGGVNEKATDTTGTADLTTDTVGKSGTTTTTIATGDTVGGHTVYETTRTYASGKTEVSRGYYDDSGKYISVGYSGKTNPVNIGKKNASTTDLSQYYGKEGKIKNGK